MDELAKAEARNYLSAAGFFILAAGFLLNIFATIGSSTFVKPVSLLNIVLGIGLLVSATLLIVLRKRDMNAILFFTIGFLQLFWSFAQPGLWDFIIFGLLVLVALVTLTSKDKAKWLLFLIPLLLLVIEIIWIGAGYNPIMFTVSCSILVVLSLYYAFCCACERCHLPGSQVLTADETTDFKASGSVLGYMLFALITGGYALHYIVGEAVLPLKTFVSIELLCGALMIFVAILLLAVGQMRFTPIMFLLLGLATILGIYSSGAMFIGIGILFIVIGLFAMLRKESRILPGIMLIVYGCTYIFTGYPTAVFLSSPAVSIILNAIPALIAIYLSFVVYSQRKLPKF